MCAQILTDSDTWDGALEIEGIVHRHQLPIYHLAELAKRKDKTWRVDPIPDDTKFYHIQE